jgi:hypothetical protein
MEYQHSAADVKTLGPVITGITKALGRSPGEVSMDQGVDQSPKKQENCRRRWGIKRMALPKKEKDATSKQQGILVSYSIEETNGNGTGYRSSQVW